MEMNLILGLVIIAAIVTIGVLIREWLKKPRRETQLELREEIALLRGKIRGFEIEIEAWKERGTRHSASRDSAEQRLSEVHKIFADMIKNLSNAENLKALLEKYTPQAKER